MVRGDPGASGTGPAGTGGEGAVDEWQVLGVRPETTGAWRDLGFDAFTAALGQGDGYGPVAAAHNARGLQRVVGSWRSTGMPETVALAWHRRGFGAKEAVAWQGAGMGLDEAAERAGRREMG